MKTMTALGLTAALMLGSVSLHAAEADSSVGRVIDDSTITTKVKAALAGDKRVSALKVHVKTFKGAVQLNGNVATTAEKTAAEEVASNVEGVHEVQNNLMVGKGRATAGSVIDDSAITTKVKAAFAGSPLVKASQISVHTKGGVVSLSGFADSAESKSEAKRLANEVSNVRRVDDNVEVRK